MSLLGTLEGIGAGDPMGAFLKSNTAAIDQAANAAAGKGLIALFNPQVPGAEPLAGSPLPPQIPMGGAPQPPPVAAPNPTNFGAPAAQAAPMGGGPIVPGATPMPPQQAAPGPPQGQPVTPQAGPQSQPQSQLPSQPQGGQPLTGPGSAANAELAQKMQMNQQLQQRLAQLQGGNAGPAQFNSQPMTPRPQGLGPPRPVSLGGPPAQPGQGGGPQPQVGPPQQAQIPPQLQAIARGVQLNAGQLDWRQLVQSVVKANPGATPEVIGAAVNKLIPLMQADSLNQWRQIQAQLGLGRLQESQYQHDQSNDINRQRLDALEDWRRAQGERSDARVQQGQQRIDETQRHHETSEGTAQQRADTGSARQEEQARHNRETESQGRQRIEIARTREGRLDRQGMARQDQQYQRLELQKQALAQRFQQTKNGDVLREWRQKLELQHQYTRTIIGSAQMDAKERKKLLKENDDWRDQQIRQMRGEPDSQSVGKSDAQGGFGDRFKPAESMPAAQ